MCLMDFQYASCIGSMVWIGMYFHRIVFVCSYPCVRCVKRLGILQVVLPWLTCKISLCNEHLDKFVFSILCVFS